MIIFEENGSHVLSNAKILPIKPSFLQLKKRESADDYPKKSKDNVEAGDSIRELLGYIYGKILTTYVFDKQLRVLPHGVCA